MKGYVLKFDELKRFLVKDAENYGCKVLCGDSVESALIENEKIRGVILENSKVSIKGKIIVDASGPSGVIASKIGLRKKVLCTPSEGLEYIMTGVSFPQKNVLSFYLGKKFAPDGYAWIFPMGPNLAKAGVAVYDASKYLKGRHIIDILKNFVSQVSWLNSAKPVELHGGSIYIKGGIKNYVFSNVLSIGDSGSQINPLGGEGIRHAMRAGRMASESIDKVLKTGVNSYLLEYQKEWKKYVALKWKISQFLTQIIYHKLNDKLIDKGLFLLQSLTPNDVSDIFFEYQFQKFLKVIKPKHFSPFLIMETLRLQFAKS
ncbi:MAG: NAD(P)/FAD-dependent oxidoreductase [Candidatus Levybacteria bacterium]|nr:NAD(P)/FAD-dependent oxidoreductase [Candidatus Levybacteria bacterium]